MQPRSPPVERRASGNRASALTTAPPSRAPFLPPASPSISSECGDPEISPSRNTLTRASSNSRPTSAETSLSAFPPRNVHTTFRRIAPAGHHKRASLLDRALLAFVSKIARSSRRPGSGPRSSRVGRGEGLARHILDCAASSLTGEASRYCSGVRTVTVWGSRLGLLSGWCRCSSFVTQRKDDPAGVFRAIRPGEEAGTGLAPACWPDQKPVRP